jgi:glutamate-1-semialdehyde 2,1-aminomutase
MRDSDTRDGKTRDSETHDSETTRSETIVQRAREVISGGAQTGLRAEAHYPEDVAFERADGATITTVDGETLTDYHLAFGPILLGHGHPAVDSAVKETIDRGVLYGAGTTELEVEVAERLVSLLSSVEMVNFCNSGSEATYHAIRLARAFTGSEKVLKFEGCYHGWHDYVDVSVYPPADEVAAGSEGPGRRGAPGGPHPQCPGDGPAAGKKTVVVPFNDPEAFRRAMETHGDDLAAVIVEPIPHSVGCLLPSDEFLNALETETNRRHVPLIFDEVITAFRHSPGGAQSELGVEPDLTCVAKAMGNGYPVAAVGGRRDLLKQAAGDHESGVVISGTYSGHPIGLAAARETLRLLEIESVRSHVTELGRRYREGLSDLVADHGIEGRVVGHRSIFSLQFGATEEPRFYADVAGIDAERFREYAKEMREQGHFFTPNPYKRHHLSLAHDEDHLRDYLDDADEVLSEL